MKLLVVLSLCVLAVSADMYTGASGDTHRLMNSIVSGSYRTAVTQALKLDQQSRANEVTDAVNRLVEAKSRHLIDFAYKLWIRNNDGKIIVRHGFPAELDKIFSGGYFKIINERDNLAIKLGAATDKHGDRTAYGDANDKASDNVSWKLVPVWAGTKLFFKIQNLSRHQYLKTGTAVDSAGDHVVYGSGAANTLRHHWYLKPAKVYGKTVFFIYNRQYNQALKLGRATDYAGDRQVYTHSGAVDGNPELFGWNLRQ